MDKSISDAVELLYKGAKMLAYHCLDCKMPLFKYEDKIICPSCKREFEIDEKGNIKLVTTKKSENIDKEKESAKNIKVSETMESIKGVKKERITYNSEKYYNIDEFKDILKNKLIIIFEKIKECNNINQLEYYINLSLKIFSLIEQLNKF